MLKIKIDCTSSDDLTFDNKKIDLKLHNDIILKLEPQNIDYIDSIIILYKCINKRINKFVTKTFVTKTFEILYKKKIIETNESQFIELIQLMKSIGFFSKRECIIQLINNKGDIIFNYNFNTCLSVPIKPIKNKKKNRSIYRQQNLYKSI